MRALVLFILLSSLAPTLAVEVNYSDFSKPPQDFLRIEASYIINEVPNAKESSLVEELRTIIEDCLINCEINFNDSE